LLELLEKFRDLPSFWDANNDDNVDYVEEFLRDGPTNLQNVADAIPWTTSTEGLWWPNSEEWALAPSPGLAYNEYYLRTRKYTKGHKKAQMRMDASEDSSSVHNVAEPIPPLQDGIQKCSVDRIRQTGKLS
jgi:hypothetical protein